jgi:hypothetical protein
MAREVGHNERHGGQCQVDWAITAPVRPATAEGLPVRVLRQVGERGQCDCKADVVRQSLRPRRRSDPEESRQQERPASASHCAQAKLFEQLSLQSRVIQATLLQYRQLCCKRTV